MVIKELPCFYVLDELEDHGELKGRLLDCFDSCKPEKLFSKDDYYDDLISKLSWSTADNMEEPWKKILLPSLTRKLETISATLGYEKVLLYQLWFQQYKKGNIHGWHIHGHNLTGVYYVELPDDAPKTEIVVPFTQKDIIVPEIKEGSILLFPSFTIHRAPKIKSDLRKTIISFNLCFDNMQRKILENISQQSELT